MTSEQVQRLSAALRAQAAGFPSALPGSGPEHGSQAPVAPGQSPQDGRRAAQARPALPAWAVLVLAALLGGAAGGLAGMISAW